MEGIFGSRIRTDVLVAVGRLGETYVSEIARVLHLAPTEVRRAVISLERTGAVATRLMGRTRVVKLEPRSGASDELYALLVKLGELPRYCDRWAAVRSRRGAIDPHRTQ